MSSSFRERCLAAARAAAPWALLGALAPGAQEAAAAETYLRPVIEARVEGNTNRDLDPVDDGDGETAGYIADVELLWGRATPRSDLQVRPRLRFQDYPERDELERLEQFLDVRGLYRTQRSEFDVAARYSRRDAYTSELLDAAFDELDPVAPTPETGILIVNNRRTRVQVRPGFTHRVSERSGFRGGLSFETTDFDTPIEGRQVDFDFALAEAGWFRVIDPRTEFSLGPYVSRYETNDDTARSDAYGLVADWRRQLTEVLRVTVSARVERNESERVQPLLGTLIEETGTEWGANVDLDRKGEVSTLKLSAGRFITPSSSGTKATSDQIRIQLDRNLSERLMWTAAARALRIRSVAESIGGGNDRDYARAELALRWAMTPTWSIRGGYEYTWSEYKVDPGDAHNSAVFIALRYEGRGRQSP